MQVNTNHLHGSSGKLLNAPAPILSPIAEHGALRSGLARADTRTSSQVSPAGSVVGGSMPSTAASTPTNVPTMHFSGVSGLVYSNSSQNLTSQQPTSSGLSGHADVTLARRQALAAITANRTASKPSNVMVAVRSRPLNDFEISMGDEDIWEYDADRGLLCERRDAAANTGNAPNKEHAFNFVFTPNAKTSDVYEAMGVPIVAAALEGYNGAFKDQIHCAT
jgi:hypothetical protein